MFPGRFPIGQILSDAFAHSRRLLLGPPPDVGWTFKLALLGALGYSAAFSVSVPFQCLQLLSRAVHGVSSEGGASPFAALGSAAVLLISLLLLLFCALFLYISARVRAAMVHAAAAAHPTGLRAALRATREAAHRYFVLLLLQGGLAIAILTALTGPMLLGPVHRAYPMHGVPYRAPTQLFATTLIFLPVMLLWALSDELLQDAILPQLVLQPAAPLRGAFTRLQELAAAAGGKLVGYLLLRQVVVMLTAFVAGVLALLASGLVAGAAFLLGMLLHQVLWPGQLVAHAAFFTLAALLALPSVAFLFCALLLAYGLAGLFQACCGLFLTRALLPASAPEPAVPAVLAAPPLPGALW